jgi:hypothetical protein
MKFLRFLFTARMSFVLFGFLAFAFTVLYLSASHRHQVPVTKQQPPAGQQH